MIRAVLVGAAGRMGRAITVAAQSEGGLRFTGAVDAARSAALGTDLGVHAGLAPLGVSIGSELAPLLSCADVVMDFSQPAVVGETLGRCAAARVPLLVGTTGLGTEQLLAAEQAARSIAVLIAPNTSLGVTLLLELVRRAAAALPTDYDIEIFEAHHREKKDAPSGTALALGRAAAQGRGRDFDDVAVRSRSGSGPRQPGEIGFAVQRAGDIVGEHSVTFAAAGERLVLGHVATDRAVFARGALAAARWLAGRHAGRYTMADVLSS